MRKRAGEDGQVLPRLTKGEKKQWMVQEKEKGEEKQRVPVCTYGWANSLASLQVCHNFQHRRENFAKRCVSLARHSRKAVLIKWHQPENEKKKFYRNIQKSFVFSYHGRGQGCEGLCNQNDKRGGDESHAS